MITTVTNRAQAEPVSLEAMKLHSRIDTTADDELIKSLIAAATSWCEAYEGQSYMAKTYKAYLDCFTDYMLLRFPPLISVDSVQYVDSGGSTQTLDASYYEVDTDRVPGRIYLAYNKTWPSTRDVPKAVTITYKAGYATTFTAATDDVITVGSEIFSEGDIVRVATDQGDLPAGLNSNTDYYVISVAGSTLQLSATSGGAAVDITDAGTGTHYIGLGGVVPDRVVAAIKLLVAHYYENREATTLSNNSPIFMGIKSLLCERVF